MYNKWANLSAISWGSTLPVYTNIAVIGELRCSILHLLTATDLFPSCHVLWHRATDADWSTVAMSLFYLAWRYNILFVTDTNIDTRGLIYPTAIKQLFTGLCLAEVCMIGLFEHR